MTVLVGRVALVTGAQQGIGRAIALAYAAAGADVAINWLDDEAGAEAVADAVRAHGRRAVTIRADVSDVAAVRAMVDAALAALGRLDILVNNAGIFPRVPMLEMEDADWDRGLDTNLKGGFFCAQAAARVMAGQGGGCIVNLGSQAMRGTARGVHYTASKGGVAAMTKGMALELAPHRIRVNAIAPGLTDTAQPRHGNTDAEIAVMAATTPLGRMAQPGDIAGTAVFLASDAAACITGQTIHVNGGSFMP